MAQNSNANSFLEVLIAGSAVINMSKYEKLYIDLFITGVRFGLLKCLGQLLRNGEQCKEVVR